MLFAKRLFALGGAKLVLMRLSALWLSICLEITPLASKHCAVSDIGTFIIIKLADE